MRPLSVLFITTVLFGDKNGCTGGEIVTSQIVKVLREIGHNVHVLGYGRPGYCSVDGETLIENRTIESRESLIDTAGWLVNAFVNRRAYSMEKYVSKNCQDIVCNMLKRQGWDYIIIDHAQMAWLVPMLLKNNIVHISHNNESQLYAGRASRSNLLGRFIFSREQYYMNQSEKILAKTSKYIWTLTHENADYFNEIGASSVAVLPVAPTIAPVDYKLNRSEYDVGLLGTWSWGPNRIGLDWFCNKVIPLLPTDIKIAIAGTGASDIANRFPQVDVLGRVPDAVNFLAKARCIAVPSIAGDGIQIKTLDAIAIGRPVISTSYALRGIGDIPTRVGVGDTPFDFAAKIQEALLKPQEMVPDNWALDRHSLFKGVLKSILI